MRAILVFTCLLLIPVLAGPARKFVRVKGSDFSRKHLIRLAKQAIKESSGSFVQVQFYGEGGGPPLVKPSHFDFENWREMFEMSANLRMQVAEAVSIGGNAVLRIRDSDGSISREIVSGRDPLRMTLAGKEFEIVYFGFSGPSRLGLQESAFIFVRTGVPLDPALGIDLYNKLEPFFPGLAVAVEVRNDAWFVYQDRYPFFNPFNEDRAVPTKRDYERTSTLKCTKIAERPRCEIVNL